MTAARIVLAVGCGLALAARAAAADPAPDPAPARAAAREPGPALDPALGPALDSAPARAADAALADRIRDLERVVEVLERKATAQRLSWSADYRLTVGRYTYQGPDPAERGARIERRTDELWTHRVRLALRAEPTPALRLRARLVAFKRFNDSAEPIASDGGQSRLPRDATARFDRFWLDWFFAPGLSASLGRTSTTDGSPAELRENLDKPAATLSLGLVDAETDVAALTWELPPVVLRAFYLSWQFARPDDPYAQLPFLPRGAPMRVFGASAQLRPRGGGLLAELSGLWIPSGRGVPPLGVPGPDGRLTQPVELPSLGQVATATGLVMWRDVVPGVLDAFAMASVSYARPNGRVLSYPIGPDGAAVPVFTLTSADATTHTGALAYAGLRVTAPVGGAHAPKLGFEATYASRYLIAFVTPSTDLISRLGVRGRTYDAYAIVPLSSALFVRASWTRLEQAYAAPLGGVIEPVPALGGTAAPIAARTDAIQLTLHAAL